MRRAGVRNKSGEASLRYIKFRIEIICPIINGSLSLELRGKVKNKDIDLEIPFLWNTAQVYC